MSEGFTAIVTSTIGHLHPDGHAIVTNHLYNTPASCPYIYTLHDGILIFFDAYAHRTRGPDPTIENLASVNGGIIGGESHSAIEDIRRHARIPELHRLSLGVVASGNRIRRSR